MEFLKRFFSPKDQLSKKLKKIEKVLRFTEFSEQEKSMIKSIVSASDLIASEVMVPRVDVARIHVNATKKELTKLIKNSLYSRFPVYGDSIDDIRGVIHIRDIFNLILSSDRNVSMKKNIQEPIFIPESRPVLDILNDLQKEYKQMAIVMDEYGGFSGIITMEDILEEIIGDIRDESDDKKQAIIAMDHLVYSVDAREDLDTINEKINLNLSDEMADSIGGYVINLFGYIPKKGEKIDHEGVTYRVLSKRGNSIIRIMVQVSEESVKKIENQTSINENGF